MNLVKIKGVSMKNQAFTLIELLVVVLIIGILAAIAVPQYQIAVAKSRFATAKNMTKTIAEAEEVYYLANGRYTTNLSDLDISKPDTISCWVWETTCACRAYINNILMSYYQNFSNINANSNDRSCTVFSVDKNDIPNKVCQQETGKTASQAICNNSDSFCTYYY